MGLSQARVAALSGLSRQTINQIEAGVVPDIGLKKAERLADVLGLALRVETGCHTRSRRSQPRMAPLVRAAASASVSYRTPMTGAQLRRILKTGAVPKELVPHVHALLDDAPVVLLVSLADQLHDEAGLSQRATWDRYRVLAHQVKCRRDLWR